MNQNFSGYNPPKRLPLPACYPDVSPSDVYLFRKVKSALIRREIPDEIDLLEATTEIFNGISDAEFQCVYRNWIECVKG
jgi:hypothetical protein